MRVFVSHGARDRWIAQQMARCIGGQGANTFVDAYDIITGDEFESRIRDELERCDEWVALLTPFSARRAWVFHEIGAVWLRGKRISAMLYGLTLADLERDDASGAGVLTRRHVRDLNEFDTYLQELKGRHHDGR